jgi:hypothetical protein
MDEKNPFHRIELLSKFYVEIMMLILFFGTLMLFIFNWETRFFGIKLDGNSADIVLFVEVIIPLIIFGLLFIQRNKKIQNFFVLIAILYAAFLLILNGCIRLLHNSVDSSDCANFNPISPIIIIFIWIPSILFTITIISQIFAKLTIAEGKD